MSIGAGCGSTVAAARKNAGKAMMKSLNYKKNTVHVLEGSEKIIGPFFGKKAPRRPGIPLRTPTCSRSCSGSPTGQN